MIFGARLGLTLSGMRLRLRLARGWQSSVIILGCLSLGMGENDSGLAKAASIVAFSSNTMLSVQRGVMASRLLAKKLATGSSCSSTGG